MWEGLGKVQPIPKAKVKGVYSIQYIQTADRHAIINIYITHQTSHHISELRKAATARIAAIAAQARPDGRPRAS